MTSPASPSITATVEDGNAVLHVHLGPRNAAGAGLIVAGLGSAAYFRSRRGARLFGSGRSGYALSLSTTMFFCGVELLFAEHTARKATRTQQLKDALADKLSNAASGGAGAQSSRPWCAMPLSGEGAPASLWFGAGLAAIDRAAKAGVLDRSTFKKSSFWTGKIMIPASLALLIPSLRQMRSKTQDYAKIKKESDTVLQTLVKKARENRPRLAAPSQ